MSITVRQYLESLFPIDWSRRRGYHLPTTDASSPYFIEWSPGPPPWGEGWRHEGKDEKGVLVVGGQYKPVDIAQYALFEYGRLKAGHLAAENAFLSQAQYLVREQRPDGSYVYHTSLPEYGATADWRSAMAQGEAISVLLRAWLWTKDIRYKTAAQLAAQPLCVSVSRGGVTYVGGEDVFFEEVATLQPCHILNGHLFAAFGVWELIRLGLASDVLANLFAASVATLSRWINLFDAQGWSYYDLAVDGGGNRHLSSFFYHTFHTAQLRVFAAMTGKDAFNRVAARWEAALGSFQHRIRLWHYGAEVATGALLRRLGMGDRRRWVPMPTEPIGEILRTH